MTREALAEVCLKRLGIRLGEPSLDYALRQLAARQEAADPSPIPVLGVNARTGVPMGIVIAPASLASSGSLT